MKKYLVMMVLLGIAFPVQSGQTLMRLFYTPAERAQIDANRAKAGKQQVSSKNQARTPQIELKGFIKRAGRPDVVFVNNENTLDSNKPLSDVRVLGVQSQDKVKVRISGKGVLKLKPGEIYSRDEQEVIEAYEKN